MEQNINLVIANFKIDLQQQDLQKPFAAQLVIKFDQQEVKTKGLQSNTDFLQWNEQFKYIHKQEQSLDFELYVMIQGQKKELYGSSKLLMSSLKVQKQVQKLSLDLKSQQDKRGSLSFDLVYYQIAAVNPIQQNNTSNQNNQITSTIVQQSQKIIKGKITISNISAKIQSDEDRTNSLGPYVIIKCGMYMEQTSICENELNNLSWTDTYTFLCDNQQQINFEIKDSGEEEENDVVLGIGSLNLSSIIQNANTNAQSIQQIVNILNQQKKVGIIQFNCQFEETAVQNQQKKQDSFIVTKSPQENNQNQQKNNINQQSSISESQQQNNSIQVKSNQLDSKNNSSVAQVQPIQQMDQQFENQDAKQSQQDKNKIINDDKPIEQQQQQTGINKQPSQIVNTQKQNNNIQNSSKQQSGIYNSIILEQLPNEDKNNYNDQIVDNQKSQIKQPIDQQLQQQQQNDYKKQQSTNIQQQNQNKIIQNSANKYDDQNNSFIDTPQPKEDQVINYNQYQDNQKSKINNQQLNSSKIDAQEKSNIKQQQQQQLNMQQQQQNDKQKLQNQNQTYNNQQNNNNDQKNQKQSQQIQLQGNQNKKQNNIIPSQQSQTIEESKKSHRSNKSDEELFEMIKKQIYGTNSQRSLFLPQIGQSRKLYLKQNSALPTKRKNQIIEKKQQYTLPYIERQYQIKQYNRPYKNYIFKYGMSNVHSAYSLQHSVPTFTFPQQERFPNTIKQKQQKYLITSLSSIFLAKSDIQGKTEKHGVGSVKGPSFGSAARFNFKKDNNAGFYQGPVIYDRINGYNW